jgi:hypothetical protein
VFRGGLEALIPVYLRKGALTPIVFQMVIFYIDKRIISQRKDFMKRDVDYRGI